MTTTRQSTRPLPTRYRDHTVIGTPTQVANVLANHSTAGTLVAMSAPRPATIHPTDPRIQVWIRLHDTSTKAMGRPRRTTGVRKVVALAVTAAGVITGLLTVAAYLLGLLVGFVTDHRATIAGALILLAIAAGLLAKGTGRTRRHCPGC